MGGSVPVVTADSVRFWLRAGLRLGGGSFRLKLEEERGGSATITLDKKTWQGLSLALGSGSGYDRVRIRVW